MAQEKGFVNESLEAILSIELDNRAKIESAIDTGFNGKLLLPRYFVEENSMILIGEEPVTMIEGDSTKIDVVKANIKWFGKIVEMDILVSEVGDCLIGTQMLIDSKLEIDYKNLNITITK